MTAPATPGWSRPSESAPLDLERFAQAAERHGQVVVGPPLEASSLTLTHTDLRLGRWLRNDSSVDQAGQAADHCLQLVHDLTE
jgi:hypothetical protein